MVSTEPRVNFASLTDEQIAQMALDLGEETFLHAVDMGLTNGDSLFIRMGFVEGGGYNQLGARAVGPDAEKFLENLGVDDGKLATVLEFRMDSVAAYEMFGNDIPEGPQRYVGGVLHVARAKTVKRGWMNRIFAVAASGVQGHLDQVTSLTVASSAGGIWSLKMQAIHGKAS